MKARDSVRESIPGYLLAFSTVALAVSLYLLYASVFILKAYCPMCLLTDAAVASARRSFEQIRLDPQARYRMLMKAAELIESRREMLARTIVAEAGFPPSDGNLTVSPPVFVLRVIRDLRGSPVAVWPRTCPLRR